MSTFVLKKYLEFMCLSSGQVIPLSRGYKFAAEYWQNTSFRLEPLLAYHSTCTCKSQLSIHHVDDIFHISESVTFNR